MIFALSQSKNHWRERESCLLTEQNKSGKAAQSIQEHIKPLPHGFFSILLSHILCLESLVQNTIPGFPHCICEFSGGGGNEEQNWLYYWLGEVFCCDKLQS
jgi:hypothetical protein